MHENLSNERLRSLWNEITMSEKINEQELEPLMIEGIKRYVGDFKPHFGGGWDIMLNEVYPIIQNELPSIFFRNPRAFLKPRNRTFIAKRRNLKTGIKEEVQLDAQKSAKTQEQILNYIISQKHVNYKTEVRKVLLDALLFPHGVLWHGYKGDFGMTEEASIYIQDEQIFVKRINPMQFIKDPSVNMANIDEGSWVGRWFDVKLQDIVEDDKLKVDKKLKGFQGYGEKVGRSKVNSLNYGRSEDLVTIDSHGDSLIKFTDEAFQKSSSSRFVRVYEIFLRPTKKEKREGKEGFILLLTREQDKPLRESPWKIKAEGFPAIPLQFNMLNDSMFAMPDIDVYKSIADQKNIITNLQIRNAQENTKVWVGINKAGADEEDIQKVQEGTNTIVLFDDDTPVGQRMFVSSPGGQASSELYLIDQRIQRNLEDKSGITDLKRGFLQSGEESATSVKIRSAGGGARPAYRQDIMTDFIKDSFHYINQLNKQFMTIKDAVRVIGSMDLEWSEEPSKEELQADVDVEIDAISMLPENPEKEMNEFMQALQLMIQAINDPGVSSKIAQEGKMFNFSPIVEQLLYRLKIRDPEVFRNIKPEESQGFVSVAEVRAARSNVEAALSGDPNIPSPPAEGQDHRARVEVYASILNLIKDLGDNIASQVLGSLIQIHQGMLAEIESKQAGVGKPVNLKAPKTQRF